MSQRKQENKYEIEVKILGIDPASLEQKLVSLGAHKAFQHRLIDRQFDYADHRLRLGGKLLRLRRFPEMLELTFKGPIDPTSSLKVREEQSVNFDASVESTLLALLEGLGLTVTALQEKDRITYDWETVHGTNRSRAACHVSIDQYPNIPAFAEVEGPDEKSVQDAIAQLGLGEYRLSTASAAELVSQYLSEKDWNNLKF